jgi:hypothetical protein
VAGNNTKENMHPRRVGPAILFYFHMCEL